MLEIVSYVFTIIAGIIAVVTFLRSHKKQQRASINEGEIKHVIVTENPKESGKVDFALRYAAVQDEKYEPYQILQFLFNLVMGVGFIIIGIHGSSTTAAVAGFAWACFAVFVFWFNHKYNRALFTNLVASLRGLDMDYSELASLSKQFEVNEWRNEHFVKKAINLLFEQKVT